MGAHARWTMPLVTQGLRLRANGLSYPAISFVFAEYHGVRVSPEAVRKMLRSHGAAPHARTRRDAFLERVA